MWSLSWPKPTAGEHTVTSRAIDNSGNIQPAMSDPYMSRSPLLYFVGIDVLVVPAR
jgi:hypothetical protein